MATFAQFAALSILMPRRILLHLTLDLDSLLPLGIASPHVLAASFVGRRQVTLVLIIQIELLTRRLDPFFPRLGKLFARTPAPPSTAATATATSLALLPHFVVRAKFSLPWLVELQIRAFGDII